MAFLSIHTMEGDPDDLLARKRRHMDPVVERIAPGFGAIASVTSKTASGVITVSLWATADGAAAFSQNQEALHAQRESGLLCRPLSSASPMQSTRSMATNDSGGTVHRTVFPARHAGLRSGGMGTVSDDIGCCESAQE